MKKEYDKIKQKSRSDKMTIREYDAIITKFNNTRFTAYYTKGVNIKLSDGTTVINIYKPGMCPATDDKNFKDAMISISGNNTNHFHYQDLLEIQNAIEAAIDYLNKENENLIDREKGCTYEKVKRQEPPKKKTKAIRYADLEIGGIYKDNKEKEWIFLGEADLYQNNEHSNRSNNAIDYSRYIYMPNIKDLIKTKDNWFKGESLTCTIDSYAAKKRFFEKIGQLDITPNRAITFYDDYDFYSVYSDVVTNKEENCQAIAAILEEREQKKQQVIESCERHQLETLAKIMNATSPTVLTITFKEQAEDSSLTCHIQEQGQTEEFSIFGYYIYHNFFWPLLHAILAAKKSENKENMDRQIVEGTTENTVNYMIEWNNLVLHIEGISTNFASNIDEVLERALETNRNERKVK